VKAALTGHLVLSTLHTNSAPETVTRLLDMGIEGFNVASAINLIVAQRLVPRVCLVCAEKYVPDDAELTAAKVNADMTLEELQFSDVALRDAKPRAMKHAAPYLSKLSLDSRIGDLPFFRGKGCEACQGTGLKGRQGLYETMNMSHPLRKLIMQQVGAAEIGKAAIAEGMLTLRMDGWLKVIKGITTLDHVVRETSV
jgi:type II secretory ATPase GspE/PulE/Tfp pilus assembly ATPase PilB-like protein